MISIAQEKKWELYFHSRGMWILILQSKFDAIIITALHELSYDKLDVHETFAHSITWLQAE
jgi:hypothetical protein